MADDESPWCAAFVGAVLAECGLAGTGSLTARSYLKWGVPGDIAVLWCGARDGWERSTLEIVEGARVWLYRLVRAAPETTETTGTTGTTGTGKRETGNDRDR